MVGSLKAPWLFEGKNVDWICTISPVPYSVSVTINTLHKAVKIAVTIDNGVFDYTTKLGDAIVKELSTP